MLMKLTTGGKQFHKIFFRLLICLLITYTCYIAMTLINTLGLLLDKHNIYFNTAFVNGLYPMPTAALVLILTITFTKKTT